MLKTLHSYIARELARVMLMALIAFTLVMTVLAIVKPLHQQGLSPSQVGQLFVYLVPVELSMTLPIAAMFAATIVYGRFSQDNELLACRASGISTFALLTPALALAGLVTVATLALSNFIAPEMTERATRKAKDNIRGIVYSQLRTRNHVQGPSSKGQILVHADHAYPDGDDLILHGVVATYMPRGGAARKMRAITAAEARARFLTEGGEHYVAVDLKKVSSGLDLFSGFHEQRQPIPPIRIPNPARERTTWYDWDRLLSTIDRPEQNAEIAAELSHIRRAIVHDMVVRDIVTTVREGDSDGPRGYVLSSGGRLYVVRAPRALSDDRHGEDRQIVLNSLGRATVAAAYWEHDPVATACRALPLPLAGPVAGSAMAARLLPAALPVVVTARQGVIDIEYDQRFEASTLSLRLRGRPELRRLSRGAGAEPVPGWQAPRMDISDRVAGDLERLDLGTVLRNAEDFTYNPGILDQISQFKDETMPKILGKVIAEMHTRIAYGVGCFLLVAIGGALGLVFRGGQVISAFAISIIPALVIIVLILVGKEMARNPSTPLAVGLGMIWFGVLIVLVADAVVYAHLIRR